MLAVNLLHLYAFRKLSVIKHRAASTERYCFRLGDCCMLLPWLLHVAVLQLQVASCRACVLDALARPTVASWSGGWAQRGQGGYALIINALGPARN